MKKILLISVLFLSLVQSNTVSSQSDTSFWFAAPFVSPDAGQKYPIILQVSTFSAAATVTINQPAALASYRYDTTFTVPANTTYNYLFWKRPMSAGPPSTVTPTLGHDSLEVRPSNTVVPYGLYIRSTTNISAVYNILATNNPESFFLKGQNALGTSFMCPFQTTRYNQTLTNMANTPAGVLQPKQQINIVACKPNTSVFITPKCNVIGHLANVTYTVILNNPGDAYTIENAVQSASIAANNLSGTQVTSNKLIAVTVADDAVKSNSGCYDLIGDQLIPVAVTGYDHILVKGTLMSSEPEGGYIVATQNNTQITINDGVVTTTIINTGDTYHYKTTQDMTYINADKKVACLQLNGFGCEYGSDIIPSLNCSGSNIVSFSRSMNQNLYIFLVCKNGAQSSFTLNNSSASVNVPIPASAFTITPGTATLAGGPYYGAKISISPATLPIGSYTITNTSDNFQMSMLEGGASSGTYFHYLTSAINNPVVSNTNTLSSICVGSTNTISLNGNVSGAVATGTWTTQNGTGVFAAYTSTLNSISTIYTLSNADTLLGNIKFYLTSIGGCVSIKDSVIIQINQRPHILTVGNFSVCANTSSVSLSGNVINALGGGWSGGNGGIFGVPGISTTYTPSMADVSTGSATFALTSSGPLPGCSNSSTNIIVTFLTLPPVTAITNPTLICVGQSATLTPGGAASYVWTPSVPGNGVISPGTTTSYTVIGTGANSCTNTAIVTQNVSLCTGISLNGNINTVISIMPNPSNGIFTVNLNTFSEQTVLEIYNNLGQIILNKKITSEKTQVDLSKYANGLYYVKIKGKEEIIKVIKE